MANLPAAQVELVRAWHAALNAGDVDQLVELSTADVEVGGPRGAGRGVELLRDWVATAGIQLEPGRIFSRDRVLVVEQRARWRSATADWGQAHQVASVFAVRDERIASVRRYADVQSVLDAAGLDENDEHASTGR